MLRRVLIQGRNVKVKEPSLPARKIHKARLYRTGFAFPYISTLAFNGQQRGAF